MGQPSPSRIQIWTRPPRPRLFELVLYRQYFLLHSLSLMIDCILEASPTRDRKQPPPKNADTTVATALSKLSIHQPPTKLSLTNLTTIAQEQKAAVEEHLELLSTEPVVLAHGVNTFFFSRPELVPDQKGRRLPAHLDKYISGAVLEALHAAVQAAAIGTYLDRLLELLEAKGADKIY